ncbi:HAD domain-containing protein [Flavobacterium plurextorum]|uniref:HAD domain-containing protein n=1 Tax=Flavobacterium TaxID=237 RepID=UPI00214D97A4|nr:MULTISPECIES: HAD domain-containing protein [Flavobacterium]UUW08679.1 HAD domain-containing protein [Flavobacterium plurextorum]
MLIFLDIDGVMVPGNSWKRPEFLNDGFPEFSPRAVKALQKIISETSADIILTTSHKSKYDLIEWKSIFKKRDLKINRIHRLEENVNYLNRRQEIMHWFNVNDCEAFIIIDDDKSLNALPTFLKSKLIQTSASVGLTDDLANQALEIIQRDRYTPA